MSIPMNFPMRFLQLTARSLPYLEEDERLLPRLTSLRYKIDFLWLPCVNQDFCWLFSHFTLAGNGIAWFYMFEECIWCSGC